VNLFGLAVFTRFRTFAELPCPLTDSILDPVSNLADTSKAIGEPVVSASSCHPRKYANLYNRALRPSILPSFAKYKRNT
jgi:hypothetical protein